MHKDIIIIPSSWRPEFLYLTLEALAKCPEVNSKEIWIVEDHKPTDDEFPDTIKETTWVVEFWMKVFGKRLIPKIRPVNTFLGNSYNVLSAYASAYQTDAKYVYLIEDDILVTKDFFEWHMWAQERHTMPFCSIAGHADGIKIKSSTFRSLGVCWKRENLKSVVEHNTPEYYTTEQGMVDYLFNKFPDTKYKFNEMIEQDGLICRIVERDKLFVQWSAENRAFHVGLWGYHRSIGQKAMIESGLHMSNPLLYRIEILRKLIRDADWLKQIASFQTDLQIPQ